MYGRSLDDVLDDIDDLVGWLRGKGERYEAFMYTHVPPEETNWIDEQAAVAGNTARGHLERLVEMNVLEAVAEGGVTRYRPDPLYTRMRALRDLIDGRDRDQLLELRAALQEQLEAWTQE